MRYRSNNSSRLVVFQRGKNPWVPEDQRLHHYPVFLEVPAGQQLHHYQQDRLNQLVLVDL